MKTKKILHNMNTIIEINYRQPNIDRFIELMLSSFQLGFNFTFHIENLPKKYKEFIYNFFVKEHNIIYSFNVINPVFYNEYILPHDLFRVNNNLESFNDMIDRIKNLKPISTMININPASIDLLKTGINKLNIIDADIVQDIINLSTVIAQIENDNEIKAQHIAEALNYLTQYQKD